MLSGIAVQPLNTERKRGFRKKRPEVTWRLTGEIVYE